RLGSVNSASEALPRRRAFELSPERFRSLAAWAVGWLVLIVATGATVRLTGSGLGCEHWPGCQPSVFFPERGYHSDVEFSNRVVASLTVFTTLVLAVASLRTRALPRSVKVLAWCVFVGTLAQAPLGAITVYFHLNPWLVITHLLLSLVVLGGGVIVALSTFVEPRPAVPAWVRLGSLVPLVALAVLVVSGTILTRSGLHYGGSYDRRLGAFADAIYLHVRATAVFGVTFLVLLGWAWRFRDRYAWVFRGSLLLLGLLLVQMAIGETQYRTQLPWWLVLIHVTMA